jgi:hypothetical protein
MTHYLRANGLYTSLIEVETTKTDLSAAIYVENYSRWLLALPEEYREDAIADFDRLYGIRGIYHEGPTKDYTPSELAERLCKEIASIWNLSYVTD